MEIHDFKYDHGSKSVNLKKIMNEFGYTEGWKTLSPNTVLIENVAYSPQSSSVVDCSSNKILRNQSWIFVLY